MLVANSVLLRTFLFLALDYTTASVLPHVRKFGQQAYLSGKTCPNFDLSENLPKLSPPGKMCTPEDLKRYRYLTIYKDHYIKRKGEEIFRGTTKQEYKDPVSEGFKHYLEIDEPDVEPPIDDGDLYLEKVKNERPKVGKMYFDTPLDHAVIKKDRLYQGITVYQADYCDVVGDAKRKLMEAEARKVPLPEGWVIPLTTQKYDYRDPLVLSSHAYDPTPQIRPVNNLDPNEKVNEILNVTTGDSEYMRHIGKLGEFVVVNQMHGEITKF